MSNHITGHTGLLCLLGSPVAHSVSPEMHNEACNQLGLDYTYLAFDVPEEKMPQAVEGLRTMGARGWNITMPGKNIMCKLADKVSPASEISGGDAPGASFPLSTHSGRASGAFFDGRQYDCQYAGAWLGGDPGGA